MSDLRADIIDLLLQIPAINGNHHAQQLLQGNKDRLPGAWRLPMAACLAVGGGDGDAIAPAAAMTCAQISIILIDDLLDSDSRGLYHQIGAGPTANLAACFQAAAFNALLQADLDKHAQVDATRLFSDMFLQTTLGQHLDAQNPDTEDGYWRVVHTKSTPFFETAFALGGLFADAKHEVIAQMKRLGFVYGEMVQIFDDLHDAMETPANADWINGRFPLPLLFASTVSHQDKERFLELRPLVSQPHALEEAQDILIRSGAISYCISELFERNSKSKDIMQVPALKNTAPLDDLFKEIIAPAKALVGAVDGESP